MAFNISLFYIRCVPDNKRAFASGVQYMLTKTLGLLPGPIIFGHVFDTACGLWQDLCGENGRCFIYDTDKVSFVLSILGIGILGKLVVKCAVTLRLRDLQGMNVHSPSHVTQPLSSSQRLGTRL